VESRFDNGEVVRFATFEVDLRSGEVRKGGVKLKLSGQPFQVLAILLERPGEVVTREELQKRLWPDTFVDVDHNLNTAINKIREMLGDGAENPRFVETLPRRGYRFIAPVEGARTDARATENRQAETAVPGRSSWALGVSVLVCASVLLAGAGLFLYKRQNAPTSPKQRTLTRITFDEGLQIGATWSPDGRFLAYSSDRGGKFDIWVQQISGGDPVQITKGPGQNWQPDWSPDGKYIAYRSEAGDGGLFVVPALGGEGQARRVSSFGYYPQWSPDSSRILFQVTDFVGLDMNRFYVVGLDDTTPRQVLKELFTGDLKIGLWAAWHPDGKRISAWIQEEKTSVVSPMPSVWTASVEGGTPVLSEITPDIQKKIGTPTEYSPVGEWRQDFKFCWAPSGKAIYFERTFQGARNMWRMSVDSQTLRATGIERLTTGPGTDADPSISADGRKLAFTGETQRVRGWLLPFDANLGRVTGAGQAVTSPGIEAWGLSLSRDGEKLVISGTRANKWELWEKSLPEGRETPVMPDDSYGRVAAQWSPDGTRLAYLRDSASTGEAEIVEWSSRNRTEERLTASSKTPRALFDWSPDGKALLISRYNASGQSEIWLLPLAARPDMEAAERRVASDPDYDLWQSYFSPDGRWIVFQAGRNHSSLVESSLYAIAAAGGPWIRLTDGKQWDDKPRWSPDGKTIYFISERNGFLNVWGIRFNPVQGKLLGSPFPVTSFGSPSLMVPKFVSNVDLSIVKDRMAITMEQVSGSIWVLDNVDR
jgi:Tol biopolymer transport system component/DNA-binding winged helix-turn-helix (wHTH) protein